MASLKFLLPSEYNRLERTLKRRREHLKNEPETALRAMQTMYKEDSESGSNSEPPLEKKRRVLKKWGERFVDEHFPDFERVAYGIPPIFFIRYNVKGVQDDKPTAPSKPTACSFNRQDSDLLGKKAERIVMRAFTLLNNQYERESEQTMFLIKQYYREHILKKLESRVNVRHPQNRAKKICLDMDVESNERYYTLPNVQEERKEHDLLIIHPTIGVIFVEIKSTGNRPFEGPSKEAITKAKKQLDTAVETFLTIMQHLDLSKIKLHKVIACPLLDLEQARSSAFIKDITEGCRLLLKNDLLQECELKEGKAERDCDVSRLGDWLGRLEKSENFQVQDMKDIIARYKGTFSSPAKFDDNTELSHTRTLGDAIGLTGKYFRRLVITEKQKKLLKTDNVSMKKVHLKGPPGSGKTTMLILKALRFLNQSGRRCVIVIDLYEKSKVIKCKGSPICYHICNALNALKPTGEDKEVRRLPLDKETNITLPKWLRSRNSDELMFIIDEAPDAECTGRVLNQQLLKDSVVWIANGSVDLSLEKLGVPSQTFQCLPMSSVLRIPPCTQAVLYNVERDVNKKSQYDYANVFDIGTDGPSPLCIRHQYHSHDVKPVLDCPQCAEDLSKLLTRMGLLEQEQSGSFLPSSIAMLTSIPGADSVTVAAQKTTKEKFTEHIDYIKGSEFIKKWKENNRNPSIEMMEEIDYAKLEEKKYWDTVFVSRVDVFHGLERDVVVFLPSETCSRQTRSMSDPNPSASSDAGLASYHWRVKDISRYTPRDQKNLVLAASRCTAQLIMMLP